MVFLAASRSIFSTSCRRWRIVSLSSPSPRYPSLYRSFAYAGRSAETRVCSDENMKTRSKANRESRHTLFDHRLNEDTRALVREAIERHNNDDDDDDDDDDEDDEDEDEYKDDLKEYKDDLKDPQHKYWKVMLEGFCDPKLSRDDLIDSYINIIARLVGSEEEAKKRIYFVSTAFNFSFVALLPEKEFRDKLKELPEVEYVLPLDNLHRRGHGQPFVNGKPARYDPFYYNLFIRIIPKDCYEYYRYNPEIEESSKPCIEDDEDLNDPKHEYWRVSMQNSPDKTQKKDEIINSYINILAQVVGSEEEAKKRIFRVSAFHEYYFGALLPEKGLRDKLEELPEVGGLVPLDIKGRSRGEPFINGKAVCEGYSENYYCEFVTYRVVYIPKPKLRNNYPDLPPCIRERLEKAAEARSKKLQNGSVFKSFGS